MFTSASSRHSLTPGAPPLLSLPSVVGVTAIAAAAAAAAAAIADNVEGPTRLLGRGYTYAG